MDQPTNNVPKQKMVTLLTIMRPENNPLQLAISAPGSALDVLNVLNRAAEIMRVNAVKQEIEAGPRIAKPW